MKVNKSVISDHCFSHFTCTYFIHPFSVFRCHFGFHEPDSHSAKVQVRQAGFDTFSLLSLLQELFLASTRNLMCVPTPTAMVGLYFYPESNFSLPRIIPRFKVLSFRTFCHFNREHLKDSELIKGQGK
jgi:hypothetical protein